jgi:hypothetical protein
VLILSANDLYCSVVQLCAGCQCLDLLLLLSLFLVILEAGLG